MTTNAFSQKDIQIISQSAAHDAAVIYAGIYGATGFDIGQFQSIHAQLFKSVIDFIVSEQETLAVETVQAAFPGSQVAPSSLYLPEPGPFDQQLTVQPAMQAPAYLPPPVPQGPPAFQQQPQPAMYAPAGAAVGYPPPQVPMPQQGYQQPPQAPQGSMESGSCPKCGQGVYDNRQNNQLRRQNGFSLQPDFKCKSDPCGNKVWPPDYTNFKHLPKPPQGFGR